MIVGTVLAGLLVVWVGSGWALAFDALTFAVAAALFTQVRVPPLAAPAAQRGLLGVTWLPGSARCCGTPGCGC